MGPDGIREAPLWTETRRVGYCLSIDARQWHRGGCLRAGQRFTWSWTWCGEALGSLDVRTETYAVILMFEPGGAEGNGSKSVAQRVPLVWTRCHFGGGRCWFRCNASIGGGPCGRRVAKLWLHGAAVFGADIAAAWRMRANRRSRAIERLAGRRS